MILSALLEWIQNSAISVLFNWILSINTGRTTPGRMAWAVLEDQRYCWLLIRGILCINGTRIKSYRVHFSPKKNERTSKDVGLAIWVYLVKWIGKQWGINKDVRKQDVRLMQVLSTHTTISIGFYKTRLLHVEYKGPGTKPQLYILIIISGQSAIWTKILICNSWSISATRNLSYHLISLDARGPFHLSGLTLIPTWISNYMH